MDSPSLGRLVNLCTIPVTDDPGHGSPSLSCRPARPQGEHGEELSEPLSEPNLHWGGSGHSHSTSENSVLAPTPGRRDALF